MITVTNKWVNLWAQLPSKEIRFKIVTKRLKMKIWHFTEYTLSSKVEIDNGENCMEISNQFDTLGIIFPTCFVWLFFKQHTRQWWYQTRKKYCFYCLLNHPPISITSRTNPILIHPRLPAFVFENTHPRIRLTGVSRCLISFRYWSCSFAIL